MASSGAAAPGAGSRLEVFVLPGIGEIRAGDDLAAIILAAAGGPDAGGPAAAYRTPGTIGSDPGMTVDDAVPGRAPLPRSTTGAILTDGDILAVTSKIVSKAEGRQVAATDREQAITDETVRVVATRAHPGGVTRIVENRQGLIMAAAGVDASNVIEGTVLLLPVDPDASARALCAALRAATGLRLGVLITDTVGRPWRDGQTDIAIGAAGVAVLDDLRGTTDAHGRRLDVTVAAVADEIAGAADLIKGKTSGNPVAVVRGLGHLVGDIDAGDRGARRLLRDSANDMFRVGSAEAYAEGYAAGVAAAAAGAAAAAAAPAAPAAPADAPAAAAAPADASAADAAPAAAAAAPADASAADAAPAAAAAAAPADAARPAEDVPASAEMPQMLPSAPSKGEFVATREIPGGDLRKDSPSTHVKGDFAATRGRAPAEDGAAGSDVPVGAPSGVGSGPEVATREIQAHDLPVGAPSGVGNGPQVATHGTASA